MNRNIRVALGSLHTHQKQSTCWREVVSFITALVRRFDGGSAPHHGNRGGCATNDRDNARLGQLHVTTEEATFLRAMLKMLHEIGAGRRV